MKTRNILLSAFLAGTSVFATAWTDSRKPTSQTGTVPVTTIDERDSAYDAAIKPNRTMRQSTRQGRASTDYNQYDVDKANQNQNQNWDNRDRNLDPMQDTRE